MLFSIVAVPLYISASSVGRFRRLSFLILLLDFQEERLEVESVINSQSFNQLFMKCMYPPQKNSERRGTGKLPGHGPEIFHRPLCQAPSSLSTDTLVGNLSLFLSPSGYELSSFVGNW